jgi:ABC-type Fe3+ transport system permease subunit
VLVIIYFSQQASFLSALSSDRHHEADHVKIAAWVTLSLVLLLGVATKGFWLERKEVRDLIDDEVTRSNRTDAMRLGFLFACGGALAAYFIALLEPLSVGEASQLVLSLGLGAALVRFGMLEHRAHRDG